MINATVVGNLGKDAELRNTGATDVLKFSVASTERRTKDTTWVSCVLFGRRAQSLSDYLKKGQKVIVVGSLVNRKWEGRDGSERRTLECTVSEVELVGGRDTAPVKSLDDAIPF